MPRSGRYCWSCGHRRPNERFSRRSSARSVCRDCYRLGPGELAYRQAVVDIARALRYGELIPKRHLHMVESLARHEDTRIRAYAAGIIERDALARRIRAEAYREDERFFAELACAERTYEVEAVEAPSWEGDAEDIPF